MDKAGKDMKFKDFTKWCNDRAFDGRWGMLEAAACIDIIGKVRKKLPWQREKFWSKEYEEQVVREIVEPINKMISELEG